MFKYRKFTGKKEVTTFVWRDSLPTEPIAGTFYWIDNKNGTALYFANYDSELLRLDNKNISELDLSDDLRKKIKGLIDTDNQIKNTIEENEKTVAASLNDLNGKIDSVSGELSDETNKRIEENNQIKNTIEENEKSTTASLNDLNEKIDVIKDEITGHIGEDNLTDELKKKINNITIDEVNNLMTIDIDDKKYYSTIFAGVSSPTIPVQSSTEITISNTKSIQITQNDTGVTTKWFVSTSKINTNDFSSWNTGTTASISGISSSLYTTYYVYAVNIKNGINSTVSSTIYKFKRQQSKPIYTVVPPDNYSTSKKCIITPKSGFVLKYSSDNSNWKSDLTSAIGVSLDGFKSNKEKTYTFYVKYLNEKTTEDSAVEKITITVGSPQIEYKSLKDIPSSVSDFSGWTAYGRTMSKDMKFNETFDYYPCFAVPSNRKLVATALGKEITPKETINLTIPSDGNDYVIYVLPKQSANVDSEMNIKIS